MCRVFALVFWMATQAIAADVSVRVCHGYGCLAEVDILYSEARLELIRDRLAVAVDPAGEREILSSVIGQLYAWAGEQSSIRNDRGGNYADAGIPGKMDCIDHSTSTGRFLQLMVDRGYLRWHRVLPPEVRYWALVFPAHYAAVIEEIVPDGGERFVVDSWFVDNGEPAIILPVSAWKNGAGPDV
jgi:hypothetical protein